MICKYCRREAGDGAVCQNCKAAIPKPAKENKENKEKSKGVDK